MVGTDLGGGGGGTLGVEAPKPFPKRQKLCTRSIMIFALACLLKSLFLILNPLFHGTSSTRANIDQHSS